jgi:hypothetical protein
MHRYLGLIPVKENSYCLRIQMCCSLVILYLLRGSYYLRADRVYINFVRFYFYTVKTFFYKQYVIKYCCVLEYDTAYFNRHVPLSSE